MAPNPRSRSAQRHKPLAEDITATGLLRTKSKKRKARPENEEGGYVDSRSSRKILKIGQDLADEEQKEYAAAAPNPAFTFESRFGAGYESDRSDAWHDDDEAWGDEEKDVVEEVEIDPNEVALFNRFLPSTTADPMIQPTTNGETEDGEGTNLTDLILEKIAAIGLLLSRYKSGKLPKPFKIIPTMPQWEELLAITRPESWTANACYEATKIFVSTKPHITQIFLRIVLLDRVREDIHETKKLNVHLFNALKKALYKPNLLLVRGHKDIGPEVRRELLEGRGRGVPIEESRDVEGDDTMMDAT
ncbi:essential nuclear protein 1, partial [Lecanoromycetidae sp. Uapishka_2]